MSWTTRITKAPNGELRLLFPEPLSQIDMDRATAKQLAALIVVAADGARVQPIEPQRLPLTAAELVDRRRGWLMTLCGYLPLGSVGPANNCEAP